MVSATDLRTGMALRIDGEIYTITECQHVKPGKGSAFTRLKIKRVKTGAVIDKTYKAADKLEDVRVERRPAQYQYNDSDTYYMMDLETYDQVPITAQLLGDATLFLKDGLTVDLLTTEDEVVGVEMPNFVELQVISTEPGVRGDTATGGTKPATLASGAVIQVPLFINEGDILKVDVRTKSYVERV